MDFFGAIGATPEHLLLHSRHERIGAQIKAKINGKIKILLPTCLVR